MTWAFRHAVRVLRQTGQAAAVGRIEATNLRVTILTDDWPWCLAPRRGDRI